MRDGSTDWVATLSRGCTPAIDHRRRFGRDVIGVREYQGQLVAVIAVDERADAPLGRHQHEEVSSGTLPVVAVAIHGTRNVMPPGGLVIRRLPIRVEILAVLSADEARLKSRELIAKSVGDPLAP